MAPAVEENDIHRDGVSQSERHLAALNPDYILVDERSIRDLLVFAQKYAAELNFFEAQDGAPVVNGDWQPFFAGVDWDEALAYLAAPEKFSPEKARPYARPHFALFLTFLKLLGLAQDQLNGLTKRHLDYYYQRVLRLRKRDLIPDQVNVLVALAPRLQQFTLPAGTLLDAGSDSQGQPLIYRTDTEITANQAQVAKLHTVFADRSADTLVDVWENRDIPNAKALIRILEMTWGDPAPGDALPDFPLSSNEDRKSIIVTDDQIAPTARLGTLYKLVDFVPGTLYLDFAEYRNLVACNIRYDKYGEAWEFINQILQKAWRAKGNHGQGDIFTIEKPKDFDNNFKKALNLTDAEVEDLFAGITQVVTLKDAYSRRGEGLVRNKIETELHLPVDDFTAMMELLIPIESNWEEIKRILTLARQTKNVNPPDLPSDIVLKDFADFNSIIQKALDFVDRVPYPTSFIGNPITNLTGYEAHLQALEKYFYLSAADFHYFMDLALTLIKPDSAKGQASGGSPSGNRRTSPEWAKVFELLDLAHKEKVYSDRKARLQAAREATEGGFEAMLYLAMGVDEPDPTQNPLDLLGKYDLSPENQTFLQSVGRREKITDDDGPEKRVHDVEWEQTYQIVERIQRVILPEPRPHIETWRNLHPLEAAKSAVVKLGVEAEAESTRWQTFGQAAGGVGPPEPTFGAAISSPLLALSQGTRSLTLTLGFDPKAFQADALSALLAYNALPKPPTPPPTIPFRIEMSTEAGWVPITAKTIKVGDSNGAAASGNYWKLIDQASPGNEESDLAGIQFELEFGEDFDPLTALPPEENPFHSPWPSVRLMMQAIKFGEEPDCKTPYLIFKALILRRVHLKVKVQNLQPSHLQNDDTVLKPGKPFEPFGLGPAVGSRFYLSHPELVNKKLDSLTFKIEWMGWPDNIATYYANCKDAADKKIVTGNESFTMKISLVNRRKEHTLLDQAKLYDPTNISQLPNNIDRLTTFTTAEAVTAWDRYIQWELGAPDFQHSTYPGRAAQLSVQMAAAIANKASAPPTNSPDDNNEIKASAYQINPPYTPKIKNLSLTYSSSLEIVVSDYQTGQEADQLYHIQPFGYSECQPDPKLQGGQMFLPQFDYEGELYLGLRDLGTARTLALLFQMAEGSADPDLPVEPVAWHYLSGNRWLSLEQGQLLDDGSRGLINSGIIRFKLNPAQPNTLLDPELYWLRAAIRRHSNSVCYAIDIHPQAVSATLAQPNDQPTGPGHLSRPLPPETITKLLKPQPQVAAIQQPYPSYGGQRPEQDETFYTRISERLRHKDRALTQWDYERVILDHFPQIYKVKCLPATPGQPGRVTIVVIPDIRQNELFDPFAPKVAANVIADIAAYLAQRTSAPVSVIVKNPRYVPLKVRFAARFQPGVDEGYAKQQLNDDLNRFLSPWAYDEAGEIVIGGRIYANIIINFLEERPYVDFVAAIKLFSSDDGTKFRLAQPSDSEGYFVTTGRLDGVLVAARRHEIDIISEVGYEHEIFTGINYMKIELDFIVG